MPPARQPMAKPDGWFKLYFRTRFNVSDVLRNHTQQTAQIIRQAHFYRVPCEAEAAAGRLQRSMPPRLAHRCRSRTLVRLR